MYMCSKQASFTQLKDNNVQHDKKNRIKTVTLSLLIAALRTNADWKPSNVGCSSIHVLGEAIPKDDGGLEKAILI